MSMATAGESDSVPRCPACGRRAASVRITRCLFCGARFGSEIAAQLDRLCRETPAEGSAELRRALLLGLGPVAAAPEGRSASRQRGLAWLLSVVLVVCLLIFGGGALLLLTGRGGLEVGGPLAGVRSLVTFVGGLAGAVLALGLIFVLGRRWLK
jgi:hypothetical protein